MMGKLTGEQMENSLLPLTKGNALLNVAVFAIGPWVLKLPGSALRPDILQGTRGL